MKLSIIAALGDNYELGFENKLLWHISADLKRFRKITFGHTVIMGRVTFNSIGNKPLSNRRNIIMTRARDRIWAGVEYAASVREAICLIDPEEEVFILGGAAIYEQFLPLVTRMYLTLVHRKYRADTFFPKYDPTEWETIEKIDITGDIQAGVDYSFLTLSRIQ
jgi:dihydrofolate reductase